MYFDLEPKNKRKDLYDFDEQFDRLMELLRAPRARAPLIAILGPKRTGKTSLIQTSLNESGLPHFVLNGSAFAETNAIRKKDLFHELERNLRDAIEAQKKWRDKILEVLSGVDWIRVDSKFPFVHFEWRRPDKKMDFMDIVYSFNTLARKNRTKFILVIDEAQEFRKLSRYRLQPPLAHTYDYIKGVQVVVTGSQVGLVHDFLGAHDPESPLYGRGYLEIHTTKLQREIATDFLRRGFKQAKIAPAKNMLSRAVDELDGVIGWLTYFGAKSVEAGGPTAAILAKAVERGIKLNRVELQNFMKTRKRARKRYMRILRDLSNVRSMSWTGLKRSLDIQEGKSIGNNVFTNLLQNLIDVNFVTKNEDGTYSISDPLLARAL